MSCILCPVCVCVCVFVLILLTHLLLLMASPAFSACTQCVFDSSHFFYCSPASFYQFHVAFCGNCNRHFPFPSRTHFTVYFVILSFCFWLLCVPHYCFLWFILGFKWFPLAFNTLCLLFGFGHDDLASSTARSPWCEHLSFDFGLVSLLVSVSFTFGFPFLESRVWFGFFILASAFDLRCLIAGVVCGCSWPLCMQQVCVNAFAHAAHKFLATFYVAFAASSSFFFFFGFGVCPTLCA